MDWRKAEEVRSGDEQRRSEQSGGQDKETAEAPSVSSGTIGEPASHHHYQGQWYE